MMDLETARKVVMALQQAIVDRINEKDLFHAKIHYNPESSFYEHIVVTANVSGYSQPLVLNNNHVQLGYIDEYPISIADPNYIDGVIEITEQHFVKKVKQCRQTGHTHSKS
jgi:predicted transcriptional regulator